MQLSGSAGKMGSNTPAHTHLDPHEAPPRKLKDVYKSWTGATALTKERLQQGLLDTGSLGSETSNKLITPDVLENYFKEFLASNELGLSEAAGEFHISESAISSDFQKSAMIQATACEIKKIPGKSFFFSYDEVVTSLHHQTHHFFLRVSIS